MPAPCVPGRGDTGASPRIPRSSRSDRERLQGADARGRVALGVAARARERGQRGHQRAHDPGGRERGPDLALEAARRTAPGAAAWACPCASRCPRARARRWSRAAAPCRARGRPRRGRAAGVVAAVGELVHAAGRDDDGLAGAGDDRAQAEAELHRALEHVEALLLLGVDVRAGDVAVGESSSSNSSSSPSVSAAVRRKSMRSPLTGLLDGLSCVGHSGAPSVGVCEKPPACDVTRRRRRGRSCGVREDDIACDPRRRAVLRQDDAGMRLGVSAALVDGTLLPGDVELVDGVVTGLGLERAPVGAGIATPGFVDLQVNGFAGVDLQRADADGFRHVGEALLRTGVTAYRPTSSRRPRRTRRRAALAPAAAPAPASSAPTSRARSSPRPAGRARSAGRRDPDAALLGRLLDAGPVTAGDARARAPRRRGADRGAARARRDRLLRPLGGVRGGRGARLRRRREHGHAPLQRDAEAGARARGGRSAAATSRSR